MQLTGCATSARPSALPEAKGPPSAEVTRVGPVAGLPPFIEHWKLIRPERSGASAQVDLYLSRDDEKRPLVLLLHGSGCEPLFHFSANGGRRGLRSALLHFPLMMEQPRRAHFLAVEKRGVRSFTSENATCSAEWETDGAKKGSRVEDAVDAIEALSREPWVSSVLVVGHSEGAQVAAGVAGVLDTKLQAVALLGGASAGQLYDFVAQARREAGPEAVDRAFADIARFAQGPLPEGQFLGLPEVRWRSFAWESTPLEDLRGSRLPVFVGHGEADRASALASADLFVAELLRQRGPHPLRYEVYPGHDHVFSPAGGGGPNQTKRVFDRFFAWATSAPGDVQVSHVEFGSPP